MSNVLKKIVVIGPESTGKSTLCAQLAAYYKTLWCPEYAREYLLKNGTDYNFDNLATIAKGQLAIEDACVQKLQITLSNNQISNTQNSIPHPSFLFIDTDMYVMQVWCQFVFGNVHSFILEEINTRKYDLYLLCNTDLPWVKDELREYPNLETRQKLFEIYFQILKSQTTPFVVISGVEKERLQKAVAAVNML